MAKTSDSKESRTQKNSWSRIVQNKSINFKTKY